jgi:hypothetical protein
MIKTRSQVTLANPDSQIFVAFITVSHSAVLKKLPRHNRNHIAFTKCVFEILSQNQSDMHPKKKLCCSGKHTAAEKSENNYAVSSCHTHFLFAMGEWKTALKRQKIEKILLYSFGSSSKAFLNSAIKVSMSFSSLSTFKSML